MFSCLQMIASRVPASSGTWLAASQRMPHTAQNLLSRLALVFDQSSTSIFAPQGTPARSIFGLSMLVLTICSVIFLVVAGLLQIGRAHV